MIRIILFDLDDTLFNRDDYIIKCYKYLCKKMNLDSKVFDYMTNEYLISGENNIFQKTINKFSLDSLLINDMLELYHDADVNISLFKDAEEFLMTNKKYRCGLITNGGKLTQQNKIKKLNLDKYFQKILITGEYFNRMEWKPNSKPFEFMLDLFNEKKENCIYIGDKFEIDVIGAFNAGLVPVLIDRTNIVDLEFRYVNNQKYYVINSFNSIDSVIKLIEAGE